MADQPRDSRTTDSVARPFSELGGHRVLDLVNTVTWRLDPSRRTDLLSDNQSATRWAQQFDLCTADEARLLGTRDVAPGLRQVREVVYAVINTKTEAAQQLLGLYQQWVNQAVMIAADDGYWYLDDSAATDNILALRIARDAVDLLTNDTQPLIKQCSDDACGWMFLDTSRNHNRIWCSAQDCGTRNRVRRHYNRHRKATPPRDVGSAVADRATSLQRHSPTAPVDPAH